MKRLTRILFAGGLLGAACSGPVLTTAPSSTDVTTTTAATTTTRRTTTTVTRSSTTVTTVLDKELDPTDTTQQAPVAPSPLDRSTEAVAARIEADIESTRKIGVRTAGSEAEHFSAAMIKASLGEAGIGFVATDVPLPTGLTSENITAVVGDGAATVLLGAHYDSAPGSPGVDDNGSGVALLLEIARQNAADPPTSFELRIVFFGAEEILEGKDRNVHHHGSRQMAATLAEAGNLPDIMISVDMVGVGSRLLAVVYEGYDSSAAVALANAGEAVGVDIITLERGDISDHEAFARAGVPAAFMWRPDNDAWHTPADTLVSTAMLLEDLIVLEAFLDSYR